MIPQFPNSKNLDIDDKREVESFTSDFPPYSDFNFTSMWSWNIKDEMALSRLNSNLVVRFTDYITGEPFYSFIGRADLDATARTLLEASARQGLSPTLKLIPHDVAQALAADTFSVVAEPEHRDYVLSVQRLRTYDGRALRMKRSQVRAFLEENPAARFQVLDLHHAETRGDLQRLFALWVNNKDAAGMPDDGRESAALSRCLECDLRSGLIAFGVFAAKTLIAFCIVEDVGRGFGISHFEKADLKSYRGVVAFLRQQVAHALCERGIRYVNLEQDLGIEGLRLSKQSYAPDHYLKKYVVRFA